MRRAVFTIGLLLAIGVAISAGKAHADPAVGNGSGAAGGIPCPTATSNVTITSCPSPGWSIGSSGGGGSTTTFAQAISSFCTTRSIAGCHYWPMNESSGTTMLDSIGSLNGTYSNDLTDGAVFLPLTPMGMPDGSVGVNMWQANAKVTGLPTPSPSETVDGIIVRICNQGTNSYLFDGYATDTNHGQGIYFYQNALQANYGTGSGNSSANSLMQNFNPTCAPMLLMLVQYWTGSAQDDYYMVNGLPNSDNVVAAPSSGLAINTYFSGGSPNAQGTGNVYCCAFHIPGNFNTTDLYPIVAAFGR